MTRISNNTIQPTSASMMDATQRATEDTLPGQTLVRVDQATYAHFLEVLEQPPSGEGFDRLMAASRPWAKTGSGILPLPAKALPIK